MSNVLLDANLLIAALDQNGTTSELLRQSATAKLTTYLENPDIRLVITPLIRYEVLRGLSWQDAEGYNNLKQVLDGFTEIDKNRNVSELAANLFRFDRTTNAGAQRNVEKRKFDVFHLACAKIHGLDLASQDTDIASLQSLFDSYQQAGGLA
jgi:predicted nucleic acid-binding protein